MTSLRLLLGGVTIGYLFSAATSFLIFVSDNQEGARTVLFWLLGSLSSAGWSSVGTTAVVTAAATGALLLAPRLDVLAAGDDTARALGMSPVRLRMLVLGVVALAIGAVVAVSGAIGFVGLIVPHVARLCGGGTHRRLPRPGHRTVVPGLRPPRNTTGAALPHGWSGQRSITYPRHRNSTGCTCTPTPGRRVRWTSGSPSARSSTTRAYPVPGSRPCTWKSP
ncbi:iron chelate uptake ABC transporter family permease subunit [Nocardia gipuzkoensis]|nr:MULTISPECIES: iron chelate uptake ABC transporter family permease subunit [Nocardia]MDE1673162.1 iron chelate uptake ABC transporter family permease subunit [Nocardia gipuzkoensis]